LIHKPQALNRKPQTLNPKPQTLDVPVVGVGSVVELGRGRGAGGIRHRLAGPQGPNPAPQTLNPKPQTLNPRL